MRVMMKVKLDTEAGTRVIEDGSIGQIMQNVFAPLNPEAAYFGPEKGRRTAFIVFDMHDPSQLPSLTEPLFGKLKADIEIFPVMNQEDLQRGLQQLAGH
jgi:hypothetical protein